MKAVIGSVHRAGSNWLASVLNQAIKAYRVEGESRVIAEDNSLNGVQEFLDYAPLNYIHVSPQFTTISKDLKVDKNVSILDIFLGGEFNQKTLDG